MRVLRIFLKSTFVAFASLIASLLLAITVVPSLGSALVDGNAWLMLTICPLMIAWPASAYTFWQSERLKSPIATLPAPTRKLAAAQSGGWRKRPAATT